MQNKDETTFSLMFELGRLIRRSVRKDSDVCTLPQFETLLFIKERTSPTMRDIAKHLRVAAPSATALINELVKARWIVRESDASDRRQVRVMLTARGTKLLNELVARRTRALEQLFKSLNESDRKEFNRILRRILQAHQ